MRLQKFGEPACNCKMKSACKCVSRTMEHLLPTSPVLSNKVTILVIFITTVDSRASYQRIENWYIITTLHCKNWRIIFIPNCHWNHTKFNSGMIPVAIWYEYHTSVFAVYLSNHCRGTLQISKSKAKDFISTLKKSYPKCAQWTAVVPYISLQKLHPYLAS